MKKKNWIIVALCVAIVGMGIGFAALAQNLEISATANITGEWDVRITGVSTSHFSGATLKDTPTWDGTSVTLEVDLAHPGAVATFNMTVENKGNIEAILSSITGITSANSIDPSEIVVEVAFADGNFGSAIYNVDTTPNLPLLTNDMIHTIIVWIYWRANPDGESVIPDLTSKTATINLNYIQNTP